MSDTTLSNAEYLKSVLQWQFSVGPLCVLHYHDAYTGLQFEYRWRGVGILLSAKRYITIRINDHRDIIFHVAGIIYPTDREPFTLKDIWRKVIHGTHRR
jgi:hypothetical protein